jgi:hypothetical protein
MRLQGHVDESGRIVLRHPPRGFKKGTAVWVEIPDDAGHLSNNTHQGTSTDTVLSARAQKILGQLQEIREKSLRDTRKTELTEKEQDRMQTFELRASLRAEQGRPE